MSKLVIKRKTPSRGKLKNVTGLAKKVEMVEKSVAKIEIPLFKAGDTLRVHVKIKEGDKYRLQAYEGLCIGIDNKGGSKSFNVRKMSYGVGVERIFLFNSPKIGKIEVVKSGKVRRAKLYYIRELEGRAAKIDEEKVYTEATPAAKK